MSLLDDLPEHVRRSEAPLAPLTWFHLGGPAEHLVEPESEAQLADVVRHCHETGTSMHLLGAGANVLIPDEGVRGVVVHLGAEVFTGFTIEDERVTAGGGADMTKLVRECVRQGLGGLEQLAGIPGTVGGGIAMNCGGRYGDISSAVVSVRVITPDGRIRTRSRDDLGFAYRHSELGGDLVTEAVFELHRTNREALDQRYREIWEYKQASQPPMAAHSAGCIFRNPPGHAAGELIDRTGLKGFRIRSAYVSTRHANFIMADEGGRAADVRCVIDEVIRRVQERTGILLTPEVQIW